MNIWGNSRFFDETINPSAKRNKIILISCVVIIFIGIIVISPDKEQKLSYNFSELNGNEIYKLAENGNVEAQCQLGFMYRDGNKIEKDLGKAFYWFNKAKEKSEIAKLQVAYAHEYKWGPVNLDIKISKKYYTELCKSSNEKIRGLAEQGIMRQFTMEFLEKLLTVQFMGASGAKLKNIEDAIDRIDVSQLTPELRAESTAYKKYFLEDAKNNDGVVWNTIMTVGKSFVSGLLGDVLGVGMAVGDAFMTGYNASQNSDKLKQSWKNIIDIAIKQNISAAWYDNVINSLRNKYNKDSQKK